MESKARYQLKSTTIQMTMNMSQSPSLQNKNDDPFPVALTGGIT